ncbi:Dabb family protein [Clavibacter zhangzhiyongii]|uniref:Dabb family protein n=1 Tax=Clavibacter zhangzhiyongii TaxID=2768071 RepID=A0A7L7Z0M8_9MICO|nr:Dabb family protein [Clavibacter zhangzhiyongii]QOD43242.1 Dabb family protein [Clavibacter zhangzhiyongii]
MTTDARPALTDAQLTARDHVPGLVHHVVLFRLRDDAPAGSHAEVDRRFRALADSPHPDGSGPYIRSLHAGTQSSPEGVGRGFELGFVLTFSSEGDRNLYLGEPLIADPARIDAQHAAFKEFVGPLLAPDPHGVLVFDFTQADGAATPSPGSGAGAYAG